MTPNCHSHYFTFIINLTEHEESHNNMDSSVRLEVIYFTGTKPIDSTTANPSSLIT